MQREIQSVYNLRVFSLEFTHSLIEGGLSFTLPSQSALSAVCWQQQQKSSRMKCTHLPVTWDSNTWLFPTTSKLIYAYRIAFNVSPLAILNWDTI